MESALLQVKGDAGAEEPDVGGRRLFETGPAEKFYFSVIFQGN